VSDNDAARLAKEAEALEVSMMTTKANGPAVQKALDGRNVPLNDLTDAAQRNVAVTHDSKDLKGASADPVQRERTKLSDIVKSTKTTTTGKAGKETSTGGPTIAVATQPAQMSAPVSNAESVIASLRPRFRRCYEAGLNQDPTISGKAVIVAKIAPNGTVQSAEVGSSQGLPASVTTCLANVVSRAEFAANGSMTTLSVPVSVVHQ
jgi:hypothetical protein